MQEIKTAGGKITTILGKTYNLPYQEMDFLLLDPDATNPRKTHELFLSGKQFWTPDEVYNHFTTDPQEATDLSDLAFSISSNGGLFDPLVIDRVVVDGKARYRIRDGNRRWCAWRKLRTDKPAEWQHRPVGCYLLDKKMDDLAIRCYLTFTHGDTATKAWAAYERGALFASLEKNMTLGEIAKEFVIKGGADEVQRIINAYKHTNEIKRYTKPGQDARKKYSQAYEAVKVKETTELLSAQPELAPALQKAIGEGKFPDNKAARNAGKILTNDKAKAALEGGTGPAAYKEAMKVLSESDASLGLFGELKGVTKNKILKNSPEIIKILKAPKKNAGHVETWKAMLSAMITVSHNAGLNIDDVIEAAQQ